MTKSRADYPKLLPAEAPSAAPPHIRTSAGAGLKRKRVHTKVACNHCRVKKWACNGERPKCSWCSNKGITCVYTSLDKTETHISSIKRENHQLQQVLGILQNASPDFSQMILLKLRHSDAPSVLQFVNGILPQNRLSEHTMARGFFPVLQSPLELELMVRHPFAYPAFGAEMDNSPLLGIMGNRSAESHPTIGSTPPYLAQSNREGSSISSTSADTSPVVESPTPAKLSSGQGSPKHRRIDSGGFQGPARPEPPPCIDHRLRGLNIGFWTSISVTNEFAIGAISLYLELDHSWLGLFDTDLFIASLTNCNNDHCSPFLVSALLAYASQGYISKDPTAYEKSYEFEAEAEKLWDDQQSTDSLPTLVGLSFLWMSHICHGSGKDALRSVTAGFEMAKRMRLFGVPNTLTAQDLLPLSKNDQSATCHTAWGCFNVTMVQTLFAAPAVTDFPPTLPIPGDAETQTLPEDDISRIKFVGVGDTFQSACKFWRIVSKILLVYRPTTGKPKAPLELALSKYRKLLDMTNQLPESMIYFKGAPSHVFVFHVWYHALILDTFRPFIADKARHDFKDYSPTTSSPHVISAASIKQLKRIILIHSNNPESTYGIWWHIALMYVASAVVKERSDPEWRPYFLLCLHCYNMLSGCFDMVQWIVPGLLAIAVQSGAISNTEAHCIKEQFRNQERRRPGGSGAGFVLDMDRAATDWNAAQADSLAAEFEDMTIFNEFTDGIV